MCVPPQISNSRRHVRGDLLTASFIGTFLRGPVVDVEAILSQRMEQVT